MGGVSETFHVVGCTDCSAHWIVCGEPRDTMCVRCRKVWATRRKLATADTVDRIIEKRSRLLAKHWGETETFARADSFAEIGERLDERPDPSELWAGLVETRIENWLEYRRTAYQESERCQGTTCRDSLAESDHPFYDESERLERLLRDPKTGDGSPIGWLAQTLFGEHVESGDADWTWVRRECDRHSWVTVERHPPGPPEIRADENRKTGSELLWANVDQSVLDNGSRRIFPRDESAGTSDAKERAEAVISGRRTLETADQWGAVIGSFGAKKLGWEQLERVNRTRFIDVGLARSGVARIADGFSGAASAGYDHGTVLTVTTDPSRFESVAATADGLLADVTNLRKKIGRHCGDGIPPSVTAPEPTKWGMAHAHIALFGVEPAELPSKRELCTYWRETRDRAQELDVEAIALDETGVEPRWFWRDDGPDAAGCPPRPYLAAGAKSIVAAARTDSDDIREIAAAYRDRGSTAIHRGDPTVADVGTSVEPAAIREASWYWATGMKAATRPSPGIRL